ncbi:homeodomain-like protein [Tanacetum coccineum]
MSFRVLAKVRKVAYKLELPQELSRVHHTFHVSNIKKCYSNEPLVMPLEGIHVDDKLQFVEEPVRWNSRRGPEFTWEREDLFKQKYPQLFTNRASSSTTRRHFKTLSLDELRLPNFNLLSDQEYSEEEVEEIVAETMEQYMSKTRADYGSGVARPKIEDKDNFELKGQFLKELHTNTFSGAISSKTAADAKTSIQEMAEYSQKWHNGTSRVRSTETSDGLAAIQAQLNNLGRQIKKEEGKALEEAYYTQFGGPFQGGGYRATAPENKGSYGPQFLKADSKASHINNSIPGKEKDPGSFTLPCFINNICFDNALVDLGASVNVMPLSTNLNLGLGELAHTKLTVELADRTMKYPKGIAENIDVYKRKITLRVGEERIVFTSVKPVSSLIKRVYMLSLIERMELDLEARLIGDTLVLNRSLDPFLKDYIELNDLNKPFELRRNQGDDLMPTIEEGKVIKEFRTRDDELSVGIDDYPSYCDYDKKIHIDCAHNLKFSCMIGFEFTHANFFPLLYVNVMSKKFHNSIMKDKMVYKGNNVVGALMNIPIFVGTFSVMTDFAVLENMNAYRDEGMGDVIFGEPFLREVRIKARRFEGMITIYNGDDEVTYQMVRSHPRFKRHTNEQCNKIPPLLKVSEKDEMNGISHAYQKLKGF